jgi:hypothetical protein
MKAREQNEFGQYHYVPITENDPMIFAQELLLEKVRDCE